MKEVSFWIQFGVSTQQYGRKLTYPLLSGSYFLKARISLRGTLPALKYRPHVHFSQIWIGFKWTLNCHDFCLLLTMQASVKEKNILLERCPSKPSWKMQDRYHKLPPPTDRQCIQRNKNKITLRKLRWHLFLGYSSTEIECFWDFVCQEQKLISLKTFLKYVLSKKKKFKIIQKRCDPWQK